MAARFISLFGRLTSAISPPPPSGAHPTYFIYGF